MIFEILSFPGGKLQRPICFKMQMGGRRAALVRTGNMKNKHTAGHSARCTFERLSKA